MSVHPTAWVKERLSEQFPIPRFGTLASVADEVPGGLRGLFFVVWPFVFPHSITAGKTQSGRAGLITH